MTIVNEEQILRLNSCLPKKLGEAIMLMRKEKDLTQTELAQLTQKDRQYIYKIEKGKVTPNIVTIGIIAKALDTRIAEILKDL